jgi:integrase
MLKKYVSITAKEKENIYNKLPKSEQGDIKDYLEYRKARGLNAQNKLEDTRTNIIHLRDVAQKPLHKLDIKEIIELSNIVKSSNYCQCAQNEIIVNLKRYVKWKNPKIDTEKLREDIKLIKDPVSKRIIRPSDLLSKEEVEKLIKHEPKMFWKAFLITQYEAGLRTKETRYLKWKDIDFNSDGDLSTINIFSTKTGKTRVVFVKEATFYLKKLKEEQENLDNKGVYIFHNKYDKNVPVNRGQISHWMSRLSKRVLGRVCWNYLLRHSRGNELYQLTKQGKISKDIAIAFMGHSENMSKVYTHDKSKEIKQMLKDQIYNLEDLPPEKKIEFAEKIDNLGKDIKGLMNKNKKLDEEILELRQEL